MLGCCEPRGRVVLTVSNPIRRVLNSVRRGRSRIGLLKMDVEGAEVVVFGGKCVWLNQVDRIAIELHDDSVFGNATEIFYNAIRGQNFEISQSGELTICSRL